ncbi:hypothetical protein QQF64_022446 [Cirrhinus molitorella]|uniref:DUF5641 domain-containing protein n=1 Tax=Cirrhinus molitorella TaxID=172907 RepID=A0ABR3L2C7_9TELE
MIMDPQHPRAHWPVGKVVGVHHSQDLKVRSVDVEVEGKVYTRPVARLVALPPIPEDESSLTCLQPCTSRERIEERPQPCTSRERIEERPQAWLLWQCFPFSTAPQRRAAVFPVRVKAPAVFFSGTSRHSTASDPADLQVLCHIVVTAHALKRPVLKPSRCERAQSPILGLQRFLCVVSVHWDQLSVSHQLCGGSSVTEAQNSSACYFHSASNLEPVLLRSGWSFAVLPEHYVRGVFEETLPFWPDGQ